MTKQLFKYQSFTILFRFFILYAILFSTSINSRANIQNVYPEIGKPCPSLNLPNISYFSKQSADLSDFKGKWLVLDFWSTGCGACVASFPKINELQERFKDKVQFMLVGLQDKQRKIQEIYSKYRKWGRLNVPCSFDSTIFKQYDIFTVPYIIIINDKGVVQAITAYIDSTSISQLLTGGHPSFLKAYRGHQVIDRVPYDSYKPYLLNRNGGYDSDYLFRSILTKFDPNIQNQSVPACIDSLYTTNGRLQALGTTVLWLYNLAYFGIWAWDMSDTLRYANYYPQPILKISDSSLFHPKFGTGQNIFCYSLQIPGNPKPGKFMEAMKRDLLTYFGFNVQVKEVTCPYWSLVKMKNDDNILRSKGDSSYITGFMDMDVNIHNVPVSNLANIINSAQNNRRDIQTPFIIKDDTGIMYNIDIDLSGYSLSNENQLKDALEKNGLRLIRKEKPMRVLEFSDGL